MNINSTLLSPYLPRVLLRKSRQIMLLSHMRGYTSLISHILGSNPAITGHFELHRSYLAPVDDLKARLTLSNLLGSVIDTPYYLDKILHNTHFVSAEYLASRSSPIVLATIREPVGALRSLIRYGQFQRGKHELARVSEPREAMRYYINRLVAIKNVATNVPGNFLYFCADDLVSAPAPTLARIWSYIGVEGDLTGTYDKSAFTGNSYRGDYSEYIQAGEIRSQRESKGDAVDIPECVMNIARSYYEEISGLLGKISA